MRVSKEKAAENRAKIVSAAAQLLRESGIDGVGVDTVAAAAGLTHGSVYSQFGSKDRLVAEALEAAFCATNSHLAERPTLSAIIKGYLSREHRDAPGHGCTLAALGCEMPRQNTQVRQRFTQGVRRFVEIIADHIGLPARAREDAAIATVSTLVGALVLARAVDDAALSDRILEASRKRLTASAQESA